MNRLRGPPAPAAAPRHAWPRMLSAAAAPPLAASPSWTCARRRSGSPGPRWTRAPAAPPGRSLARGVRARRPGGHRAPHRAGLPRRLLRRAARRGGAGAALPAGAARAHGRVRRRPPRACCAVSGARVRGHLADAWPGSSAGPWPRAGAGLDLGRGGRRRARRRGRRPRCRAPAADLALVQFSSGSTVDPEAGGAHPRRAWSPRSSHSWSSCGPTPRGRARLVAAALPRHGAHRLPARRGLLPGAARAHPARALPGPPGALAPRASARHRGTISAAPHFAYAYAAERVRDADLAGLSLAELAHRPRRRRAGHRRRPAALRRALRPLRLRPGRAHAGLRALRGGAGGDLLAARPAAARRGARPGAPRRRRGGAGPPRGGLGRRPVPGVEVEVRGRGRARRSRSGGSAASTCAARR